MEHCCPKCVNFSINEGHTVLKIPSWVRVCPCLPRIFYKLMLGCCNSQGTSPESEILRLWPSAPCLAQGRQSIDVSFINELVTKWVMSEWMNERVKYLSPKETKLDTALVEEAADWSINVWECFKNLSSMRRTQCQSCRNPSLGRWNESCQVWHENLKMPAVWFDCLMLSVCLVRLLICLRYNVNGTEL